MSRVGERSRLSPAEYLAWEREQETKHEFFRGEVFAMSGGSYRHNALGASVISTLKAALVGRPCVVFSSEQRVGIDGDRYVYPDATVVCGAIVSDGVTTDVLANPGVVVEVLSSSTEPYDRGLKWEAYQRIASLGDYLLVAQVEARIEHFRRERGSGWHYQTYGPGERIVLALGLTLDVDALYAGAFELPGD